MGLIMLIFTRAVAEFLGPWPNWIPAAIGAGLILFAGDLIWLQRRLQNHSAPWLRSVVLTVISMDLLWVVGTIVLLSLSPAWISQSGLLVLAVVAIPVQILALVQWKGLQQRAVDNKAQQALL